MEPYIEFIVTLQNCRFWLVKVGFEVGERSCSYSVAPSHKGAKAHIRSAWSQP